MTKRVTIVADDDTIAAAYDATEIALVSKDKLHTIIFYSATEQWRDDL